MGRQHGLSQVSQNGSRAVHSRSKHYAVKDHWKLPGTNTIINYIESGKQIADILTKSLTVARF